MRTLRESGGPPVAAYDPCVPEIVLIEDEPGIVDFVERGLRAGGLDVSSALDGDRGLELALADGVDLVVLDLMLPGRSGLEVLEVLRRRRPGLPVIVLTARGELEDRVVGLDAGAVDYLVKPFLLAELAARIRAHLRVARQSATTTLRSGDLELDLLTRDVRCAGTVVHLSTTEFELLAYLVHNAGQVLGREQILRAVWGYEHDPGTNVVDVYVGYLRRKLGQTGRPARIATIRSVGYRLDESE
jgi:two-component system, OmpR family, response regulator